MAADIYSTNVLNGVVQNLIRPQSALLDTFFPGLDVTSSESISFDVAIGKRRIAPLVHPSLAGKMVEGLGFKTNTFKPAYVKDKRIFDPKRGLKRQIGERIGGSASPTSRVQAALVQELTDQTEMLTRLYEVMSSEILRTGRVTIKGDGFDTVVVDFLRNSAHTITLAGALRWGQAGVVPLDDINSWSSMVLQNSGASIRSVFMSPDAWDLFIADPKTEKQLNDRRIDQPDVKKLSNGSMLGLNFQGSIGDRDYWTYQDWYVDPDTGLEVPMMPAYTVILGSAAIEGVRHFGAIQDEDNNFEAIQMFTKSWIEKDPSKRILLMQAAPLVVPYRPDGSVGATVN